MFTNYDKCLYHFFQLCIQNSKTRKDEKTKRVISGKSLIGKSENKIIPASTAPTKGSNKSGRLITIPLHVLSKIDTKAPFALKLNNETFKIDPSRLIKTANGVKIFIKNDQVVKPDIVPKPKVCTINSTLHKNQIRCNILSFGAHQNCRTPESSGTSSNGMDTVMI